MRTLRGVSMGEALRTGFNNGGFGAVKSPVPFLPAGVNVTIPGAAPTVPFYKKPLFWLLVLGAGGFWYWKKKGGGKSPLALLKRAAG